MSREYSQNHGDELLEHLSWWRIYSNKECINNGNCYVDKKCHSVGKWFHCKHVQCYINEIDRPCCVICGNSNRSTRKSCKICVTELIPGHVSNFCIVCEGDIIFEIHRRCFQELLEKYPAI